MRRLIVRFLLDNSLTLVFAGLFVLSFVGQAICGLGVYNEIQAEHGAESAGFWEYLLQGAFLAGVFSNWQAAILQLAMLILLGVFLYQRGSPHSRRSLSAPPRPLPPGRARSWVYRNSLSIGMFGLFVIAFVLHILAGHAADTAERELHHLPPVSLAAFMLSAKFWFSTFQTWQAEFMAIVAYVVLSIYLRQDRSPESKPVTASDRDTGTTDT